VATTRTTKVMGFSVPPAVVKEVENLAKRERRTKSELFREMVRVYVRYRELREFDEDRWIANLIQEARKEQASAPATVEEMLRESERLARYGARQAAKLGIKPGDTDRLIHAHRRR
jgi:metal-responsive CopG/Arc/MetJ family transcriptional regulator